MQRLIASEMIKQLESMIENYGDLPVVLIDPDTESWMDVKLLKPFKGIHPDANQNWTNIYTSDKAIFIEGSGYGETIDDEELTQIPLADRGENIDAIKLKLKQKDSHDKR